jgi:hypothetical protein
MVLTSANNKALAYAGALFYLKKQLSYISY